MLIQADCLQQLRLLDSCGDTIIDQILTTFGQAGKWQRIAIPPGQEIIGLQCNTSDLFLNSLGFITWTPNKDAVPADRETEAARYMNQLKSQEPQEK